MEDILDVYQRPYDPQRPQVCLDETSKQLVGHVQTPIAARPGVRERVDDEYTREGTANIFAAIEPITGKSLVEAIARSARAASLSRRRLRRDPADVPDRSDRSEARC
jgi:hypothetical protein